jgi:hypothetical protein
MYDGCCGRPLPHEVKRQSRAGALETFLWVIQTFGERRLRSLKSAELERSPIFLS